MSNLTSKLKNKIDIYSKVEFINEVGEKDFRYEKTKSVFANITSEKSSGSVCNNGTTITCMEITHKFIIRKLSLNLVRDMYFMYQGLRYDIVYFQVDFNSNEYWEIMCKVKFE